MNDLNASNSSVKRKGFSSILLRITNIRNRLQNLYKKITDYTYNNSERVNTKVEEVNALKNQCKKLKNLDFVAKTDEFRRRLRNGETIEDIMVEALAVAREATDRQLHMFQYNVQVEAAIAMIGNSYKGKDEDGNEKEYYQKVIAEMKTGEGKTLVQILVTYLNLLEATKDEDKSKWKSVQIMTSNDALAKRDADANRSVFEILGFSVGYVPSRRGFGTMSDADIKKYKLDNYSRDVVYASPSTIAFDYLHDNIVMKPEEVYQKKPFGFVLIDEADDILIDQATSPLRLTAPFTGFDDEYMEKVHKEEERRQKIFSLVTQLLYGKTEYKENGLRYTVFDHESDIKNSTFIADYAIALDTHEVYFNKEGKVDEILNQMFDNDEDYNEAYMALYTCMKARHFFNNEKEYIVRSEPGSDGTKRKITLIDQNIGRVKLTSKYVGGIHEAIEAKEEFLEQYDVNAQKRYHIEHSEETPTRAMFTYPDFLSIYEGRVSGMTGTSDEEELKHLYGFETYRVPTRKKNIRIDEEPELYATKEGKYNAILNEVKKCIITHQPVLIGTTSIKESIEISNLLKENHIMHNLLNATNEAEENEIIKVAGKYGAITVATNMAGRGTDIKLGGEDATLDEKREIQNLGGLYVIGTSINRSSRIDKQLRGRAARQGDPGRTKYFFSLEDDLVKECYKGDVLKFVIQEYDNGLPIRNKKVYKAATRCQELKESKDKLHRSSTEKFNMAFMQQRKAMYSQRNLVLNSSAVEISEMIVRVAKKYASIMVEEYGIERIHDLVGHIVDVDACYHSDKKIFKENLSRAIILTYENVINSIFKVNKHKSYEFMLELKDKMLNILDVYWIDHISELDGLKRSSSFDKNSDPLKLYGYAANDKFYKDVIPSIYNEMLTYATNPDLKFGDYEIKFSEEAMAEQKIML